MVTHVLNASLYTSPPLLTLPLTCLPALLSALHPLDKQFVDRLFFDLYPQLVTSSLFILWNTLMLIASCAYCRVIQF